MAFTPPPANWQTWKNIDDCPLWHAVILTLGHEPRYFAFHPQSEERDLIVASMHLALMPQAAVYQTGLELVDSILDRLMVAKSNASKKFKIGSYYSRLSLGSVELPEFGAWAASVWPDLHPDFPRPMPSASEKPAEPGKEPSTKERTSLLVIIGALAKEAGIDISRPTIAAQQIEKIAREELKAEISVKTIADHLNKVDDALDRRSIDRKD